MAVRTRRLAAGSAPASALTTLYQVPADRVAIVKFLAIEFTATGAGTVTLSVGLLAGVGVMLATITAPPLGPWLTWWGLELAMVETDQLRLATPAGVTADYWVSGALLAGDPA